MTAFDLSTDAWSLFGHFLAMSLLSLATYAALPWSLWSLLANVLTPLAVVALFVGEHVLRYRLHPEFERARLVDVVRAYSRAAPATDARAG